MITVKTITPAQLAEVLTAGNDAQMRVVSALDPYSEDLTGVLVPAPVSQWLSKATLAWPDYSFSNIVQPAPDLLLVKYVHRALALHARWSIRRDGKELAFYQVGFDTQLLQDALSDHYLALVGRADEINAQAKAVGEVLNEVQLVGA